MVLLYRIGLVILIFVMKAFKKISQNQLIGLVTFVFVVLLLGILYVAKVPVGENESFDPNEVPPLVTIDTGYNATLSGEPFYVVEENDERFDDGLEACGDLGTESYRIGVQNGWYQVVAYEDGMTVEDVIFEQINVSEGDKMVAVIYNSEDQEFMAWPNKIIVNGSGDNVEILERDFELDKGTVVSVSVNRDVEYCFDYSEIGVHENIDLKWNLVSKPDFEKVDYRAIWEVAFAKGGDSGVDPERYYSYTDPSNSIEPEDLPDEELYWVYGGAPQEIVEGGDLGEEPGDSGGQSQKIVVKVANSIDGSNVAGQRDIVEGETFQINEKGGEVRYSVGLLEPADGEVELEFEIYEDGNLVQVQDAEEIASRSVASGANAFARGKNFRDGENTLTSFNLVAIDDEVGELPKSVEFKVVDKSRNLSPVSFKIDIVDDETDAVACTMEARPGLVLTVQGLRGDIIKDATVIAIKDGLEVERQNETLLGGDNYSMLFENDGDFEIRVEKSGVESKSISVQIEKDECHVITEERTVTLENEVLPYIENEGAVFSLSGKDHVVVLELPSENANVVLQSQYQPQDRSLPYSLVRRGEFMVLEISGADRGNYTLQVQYAKSDSQNDIENNSVNASYLFEITE